MTRTMNVVGLGASALLLACCVVLALACLPSGLSFFGRAADAYGTYSALSPATAMSMPRAAHFEILKGLFESWFYLCAAAGLSFLAAAGIAQVYSRLSDTLSVLSDR